MYYISELHMGGPTLDYKLMDSTDCWGPYKSLSKARKMFKENSSSSKKRPPDTQFSITKYICRLELGAGAP